MSATKDLLQDTKAGDILLFHPGGFGIGSNKKSLVTVSRTTKTQIAIQTGIKFHKSGGESVGAVGQWESKAWVSIPTDAEIEEIHKEHAINNLIALLKTGKVKADSARINEIAGELES